jgi:hypothetical protein
MSATAKQQEAVVLVEARMLVMVKALTLVV